MRTSYFQYLPLFVWVEVCWLLLSIKYVVISFLQIPFSSDSDIKNRFLTFGL